MLKETLRIYPPPATGLYVKDIYTEIDVPSENLWDSSLPYIAINMVSSLDGMTAVDGTADSIGGPADRRVMRNIRSRFDAVLRGAGTVRADRISLGVSEDLARLRVTEGREAQPLDLILSGGITEIPLDTNLLDVTPGRVALLVPLNSTTAVREDISIIQMPATSSGNVDLLTAMEILKQNHGVHSLLLEGGPSLNYSFVSLNIVNELFLTLAPKLLAGVSDDSLTLTSWTGVTPMSAETLRLTSAHVSDGELFLRYAF